MESYNERGPASLSDNLKYINDTVSHLEINRFNGACDKMGYQIVCKAITMNVVTGKKCFVIWAVQEGYDELEIIIQKAKDELRNRIAMGCPVLDEGLPTPTFPHIKLPHLTEIK
jgi:hypothetical protein